MMPSQIAFAVERNGRRVAFASLDDLEQWVTREEASWEWMKEAGQQELIIRQLHQNLVSVYNEVRSEISSARKLEQDPQFGTSLQKLADSLDKKWATRRLVASDSPEGLFLSSLSIHDPLRAASALRYFTAHGGEQVQRAWLPGFFDAYVFDKGLAKDSVDQTRTGLEALRAEWYSELSKAQTDTAAQIRAAEAFAGAEGEASSRREGEFNTFIDDAKKTMEAFQTTYDTKLSLAAPVSYWEQQASSHGQDAKRWQRKTYFVGGTMVLLFLLVTAFAFLRAKTISDVTPWDLGVVVTMASLTVWLVRLHVRVWFSHLHLATDAGERTVQAKAFLALMREGHALGDQDRRLVLSVLFRPAATGLVKEDSAPFSPLEWLTRGPGK